MRWGGVRGRAGCPGIVGVGEAGRCKGVSEVACIHSIPCFWLVSGWMAVPFLGMRGGADLGGRHTVFMFEKAGSEGPGWLHIEMSRGWMVMFPEFRRKID